MTSSVKARWRVVLAVWSTAGVALGATGCQPVKAPPAGALPPAYTSNQITDPTLIKIAEEIKTWGLQQAADQNPLYGRVEVLPPVPIVQPYGVGVFQQEVRLPTIFTTGPGWASLGAEEKEAVIVQAFNHISTILKEVERDPPLQATLTVQTPQGMELTWINRLEPNRKNVHGDD